MLRLISSTLLLTLSLCSVIAQDQSYTPGQGTRERQAIVDALRSPVQKHLRKKVIFKIEHLKVQGDWAFMRGVPQQPGGGAMSYGDTVYQVAIDAGAFDDGIVALLRKRGGKWQVVKYVIGATDVPYLEWDKQYHAPSGIFQEQ